jgi:hypothetical protein
MRPSKLRRDQRAEMCGEVGGSFLCVASADAAEATFAAAAESVRYRDDALSLDER